jgi:hypothetical protein
MRDRLTTFLQVPCKKMAPTLKHRPAVWGGILGTVYAYDGAEIRYFDYDHQGALEFAGVRQDRDPRVWTNASSRVRRHGACSKYGQGPSAKQSVLYIINQEAK